MNTPRMCSNTQLLAWMAITWTSLAGLDRLRADEPLPGVVIASSPAAGKAAAPTAPTAPAPAEPSAELGVPVSVPQPVERLDTSVRPTGLFGRGAAGAPFSSSMPGTGILGQGTSSAPFSGSMPGMGPFGQGAPTASYSSTMPGMGSFGQGAPYSGSMPGTGSFGQPTPDASYSVPMPATRLGSARVMPVGPSIDGTPTPSPYTWQTSPTAAPRPGTGARTGPAPGTSWPGTSGTVIQGAPLTTSPLPGGPISSAPLAGGPVSSGPIPDGPLSGPLPPSAAGTCDGNGGACCDAGGACCNAGGGCCDAGGACCDANGCCDGGCCADDGCCGCWNACCYPGNRFYASGEYLLWWVRGFPTPPLVTSGSVGDTRPGALGQAGTQTLIGGRDYLTAPFSGGRFFIGYWFGPCRGLGVEVGTFFLGPRSDTLSVASAGVPLLARPFTLPDGSQAAELVANPANPGVAALSGSASVYMRSFLWGAEGNLRTHLCCGCNYYLDVLGGFRNLNLYEDLRITENLTVQSGPAAGDSLTIMDRFKTNNSFYGGQMGLAGEVRWGRWSVGGWGKVALGDTQQVVMINGGSSLAVPGMATISQTGGLLALPSNIGTHTHNVFGVVPEANINLGYQFTQHLRGFVGYNFLYWSSVARPGNQIDQTVNVANLPLPGPAGTSDPQRPAFTFHGSSFWAQGINFGLEFRY